MRSPQGRPRRPRYGGDWTGGFDDPRRNDSSGPEELTLNGRRY